MSNGIYEIREFVDDHGKEIKSVVVNVNEEFNQMKDQFSKITINEENSDKRKQAESLLETLQKDLSQSGGGGEVCDGGSEEMYDISEDLSFVRDLEASYRASQTATDAMSVLEMLEQKELEEKQEKENSRKNAVKLAGNSSGGWKKGFFGNDKKTSKVVAGKSLGSIPAVNNSGKNNRNDSLPVPPVLKEYPSIDKASETNPATGVPMSSGDKGPSKKVVKFADTTSINAAGDERTTTNADKNQTISKPDTEEIQRKPVSMVNTAFSGKIVERVFD